MATKPPITMFPGDDEDEDLLLTNIDFVSAEKTITKKASDKDEKVSDENNKKRLDKLEKRITDVINNFDELEKCCKRNSEVLSRLEEHAETLRKTMVALAIKIDLQTGRRSSLKP
ncbi:IMV membrane protein, fusion [Eptesipox virus]|nr:IMV membrane protein, fusion [Eptesipox virus]